MSLEKSNTVCNNNYFRGWTGVILDTLEYVKYRECRIHMELWFRPQSSWCQTPFGYHVDRVKVWTDRRHAPAECSACSSHRLHQELFHFGRLQLTERRMSADHKQRRSCQETWQMENGWNVKTKNDMEEGFPINCECLCMNAFTHFHLNGTVKCDYD